MFNYCRNYPYYISQTPISRSTADKNYIPDKPKPLPPPPPCKPPKKKNIPPKKKFNLKNFKKNTCTSLNDVECFLNDFSHTLKYIRLINLLK